MKEIYTTDIEQLLNYTIINIALWSIRLKQQESSFTIQKT